MKAPKVQHGYLYVVGVPIGNWDDITLRALNTLKQVNTIAAEDTRKAQKLLANYGITGKRLLSYFAGNEQQSAPGLLKVLLNGEDIALITDSGMPGISDPGYALVAAARAAEVPVQVIPGVTAATTLLAAAGLPCDTFTFMGFPPRKKGEQQRLFTQLVTRSETLVFYESPRRVVPTLAQMVAAFGAERMACMGRELTKTHEEIIRSPLQQLHDMLAARQEVLGEICLLVQGASAHNKPMDAVALTRALQAGIQAGHSIKTLKQQLATQFDCRPAQVYDLYVQLEKEK